MSKEDVDEVYIVMRNRETGIQSYILLTDVTALDFDYEMEYDHPNAVPLFGGLGVWQPNPKVVSTTMNMSVTARKRGMGVDMDTFPIEEMREYLNGDQP